MDFDSISHFFGLSYNPYLVVPRSLLESMPDDWQTRLCDLLGELHDAPQAQNWTEAHYYVQRTDPERDAEIHDASLHNRTRDKDDDEVEVPALKVIEDPYRNYRHRDKRVFAR